MAITGKKATEAFKNIREVSEDLDVPQHVLRFWESKFSEIRPLKRGGRRRYYRPEDVGLLRTIRDLLYVQGYKIRGVQRLLREGKVTTVDSVVSVAPAEELAAEGLSPDGMAMEDLNEAGGFGNDQIDRTTQSDSGPTDAVEYQEIEVAEVGLEQLGLVQNRLMAARTTLLNALQAA